MRRRGKNNCSTNVPQKWKFRQKREKARRIRVTCSWHDGLDGLDAFDSIRPEVRRFLWLKYFRELWFRQMLSDLRSVRRQHVYKFLFMP